MISLPTWLASPLRLVTGIILLLAFGAGAVVGLRWWRNSDEKQAVESKPAIANNQRSIDTATSHNVALTRDYRASATEFRAHASAAHASPNTAPETRACYESGLTIISRCDSLHRSDSSLIELYRQRAKLMEDEAVRARRGKLLQVTAAGGWDPRWGAPVARAGVELNVADHWSVTATHDFAIRLSRDSTGRSRSRNTEFIGLTYRFGGRN